MASSRQSILPRVPEGVHPITINDCVALALASYDDVSVKPRGWTQIHHGGIGTKGDPKYGGGFYGVAFRRDQDVIIAFRGTLGLTDIVDDASMVPFKTPEEARDFGKKFVQLYSNETEPNAARIAGWVYDAWRAKIIERGKALILDERLNQLPPGQMTALDTFVRDVFQTDLGYKLRFRAFVGHSLGGALAQAASENYTRIEYTKQNYFNFTGKDGKPVPMNREYIMKDVSIPAVTFNAPYMGKIDGMKSGQGPGIVCIDSMLDPLSNAMRLAGNKSHAIQIIKLNSIALNYRSNYSSDIKVFLNYLGNAAGSAHSLPPLAAEIRRSGVGNRKLSSWFTPTEGVGDRIGKKQNA